MRTPQYKLIAGGAGAEPELYRLGGPRGDEPVTPVDSDLQADRRAAGSEPSNSSDTARVMAELEGSLRSKLAALEPVPGAGREIPPPGAAVVRRLQALGYMQ